MVKEKNNTTHNKELWSALTKIILENKDWFFDFFDILENPIVWNEESKNSSIWKSKTEKIIYTTSMALIDQNILSLQEIEEIIKHNPSLARHWQNNKFLKLGAMVCKKTWIDIKKIFSVCTDISVNIPTIKDKNKQNIPDDKRDVVFNERSLKTLKKVMWNENFKEAMGWDWGFEIIQEMNISWNIYQRMRILFFLFDYHLEKKNIHISPLNILQEIFDKCWEHWTMENIYIIANFLSYITDKSLERNKIPNLESLDILCSPENIIYFAENNHHEIMNFIELIKMFSTKWIISIDINDYKVWYEWVLKNIEVKEEIADLLEKSSKDQLRAWESVILHVATTKVKHMIEATSLPIEIPNDIQQYNDDYFFENRNSLLKDLYIFSKEEIIHWDMQDHKLLQFLQGSLPRWLSQISFFIDVLLKLIHQKKEGNSERIQDINNNLGKFWLHMYNRPFELQKNFYSISMFLLQHDIHAYQSFVEDLSGLSKQNRKHFVEKIVPLIEPQIMILKELKIENIDTTTNEDGSPKPKSIEIISISSFIESFFEKIGNWTTIGELEQQMNNDDNIKIYKKAFMEKRLGIKSPEVYLEEYTEITEYVFKYACNLSQKNEKNLISIWTILATVKNDSRNEFRIDKSIPKEEFTDEGNEAIKEITTDQERDYRKSLINKETRITLQEDAYHTTTILPQTIWEKIFNIQQSLEELYDPDIYEDPDVKSFAEKFFQKKNKQMTLKNIEDNEEQSNFMKKNIPILQFTDKIESLNLNELFKKLKYNEEQWTPISKELEEDWKKTIQDAIIIFKDIVSTYKKSWIADTAQIRIEEVANNFSLEVDELSRLVSPTNEFQNPIKIKSRITNDIVEIIKNIRGCLWCMQKNSNNHTNLDFMSPNRFIIFSGKEDEFWSNIADQICILSETDQWLCFIMDGLYGARMSNILLNHCLTVIEKIQSVKEQQIKIFIPKTSIKSAGTNTTHFQSLLNKEIMDKNIHMEYTTIRSDIEHLWYQELGLKEWSTEGILLYVK